MSNRITDVIVAPWKIGVIFAAIRLKIFSILDYHKLAVEEIASIAKAKPRYLKTLLDACVSLGFLNTVDDKYMNTQFSQEYFVEGQPLYVGDFINVVSDEMPQWFKLPDIILGKENMNETHPYIRSDYDTFIRAMNNIGNLGEANALKDAVDLTGCREMVDIGGGSGLYSIALCQKNPELHSTIIDVKEALSITKEMIGKYKDHERITLREGDFLNESFGENVDLVLLSDVIYEISEARLVLQSAWNCLRRNGTLIIRGYYSDPENTGPLFGALFSVKLLVGNPRGTILTIKMLEKSIRDAGFKTYKISPLTEYSFIIIGEK